MIIPELLKKGDTVRIIAPSTTGSVLSLENKEIAIKKFNEMGLNVTFSKNFNETTDYLNCGTIEERVEDLHEAFKDKEVKAIFTVLGGYNANQLLDYIDYDIIKQNPKIFCGFSDITVLSNAIYKKTGLVTYSGPNFSNFAMKTGFDYTLEYFKKMFFTSESYEIENSKYWSNDAWYKDQSNRKEYQNEGTFIINNGVSEGIIVGGNLCTLNLLQGTEYMPSLKDSILFIEDDALSRDDFVYEFDRNLQSLINLPDFKYVKGIVLGRAEVESNMTKEKWIAIIKTKKELNNIPVIANADFGHTTPAFTFPIGGKVSVEAKENIKIKILK